MPRASWVQTNFNGGEWSPLAYGRVDNDAYKRSLATCKNYIPTVQGGLTRRPGTAYVAPTKSNATARLVAFEFSNTQTYVLEFGDLYVRFYTNDGQLMSGGVPYEITTLYSIADVWGLSFTQSADTLYIAHKSYFPRKLQRLGPTSWVYSPLNGGFTGYTGSGPTADSHSVDGPYLNTNTTSTTLTPAATGSGGSGAAAISVTASSTTGINGGAGFSSSLDMNRVIRLKLGATWVWGIIQSVPSSTNINVKFVNAVTSTSATTQWRLGAWYGGSVYSGGDPKNYPSVVTFHQDRLVFAGCPDYPNRIDASNTSDYENFAPSKQDDTVVASHALAFTLNSRKVNVINWLASDMTGLLAGTANAEWVIAASTAQEALTPTNVNAKVVSEYGSTTVPPVRVGQSTLFVQRTKRKLRELTYEYTIGGALFKAMDISAVAEHLTTTGIKQMAVQLAPQPVIWIVRNDGKLVALSYDKDANVLGWHQHEFGGYSDAAQTLPPVVESVACIPAPAGDRDEVWVSVQRYVNGATVRTVEYMTKFWEDGDALTDAWFVDCGAQYSGAATSTITGLTWLKGQTVKVLGDGSVHPDCVVDASGNITLQRSVTKAQVGLGYTSTGKTLRIEAGAADGTAQGKYKRIHRAIFRFFQTVGQQVQATNGNAYPEPFRSSADAMDNPVALYTGDKRWAWEGSYEIEGQISWSQADPLPSNVLMIVAQLETQDGG